MPERAGKPWDSEESKQIVEKYDCGATINEIAKEHKRTQWAIKRQLIKLGRLNEKTD